MKKINLKVGKIDAGRRLDQYLVKALDNKYSRTYIKNLINSNLILVNDNPSRVHFKVKAGDEIKINFPPEDKVRPEPEEINIDIIYEDDSILIINKPAGMIVHPASGNYKHTLVNALVYYTKDLSDVAGCNKPGIVHRLDKDTSGLLVVAKNNEVHKRLTQQFKDRTVKRKYIALVDGVIQIDRGVIDAPIGRSQVNRKKMGINYLSKKDALTQYEVLRRFQKASLLELTLKTGRTHQARLHLKHIGHPIIGDVSYGIKKDACRQMLHAKLLGFIHPRKDEYVEFESPIPDDMKTYIEHLSKEN